MGDPLVEMEVSALRATGDIEVLAVLRAPRQPEPGPRGHIHRVRARRRRTRRGPPRHVMTMASPAGRRLGLGRLEVDRYLVLG